MIMRSLFKQIFMMDILWVILGVYVTYGAYLAIRQERIMYQPTPQDFYSCAAFAGAEKITQEGTRIYFKNNGPRAVVLYHGNFGSACDRAFYAEMFERAGYSYILPEYAGYSNDGVAPSHERIKKDVEHTVDFLRTRNFSEVVVLGESIGDSFAAYHTSLLPPQKLLLISSFIDFQRIAKAHYGYYPVSLLVKNPFNNVVLIGDFPGSILLIHGEKDDIIPLALGQELFAELASPQKELVVIRGAGHNDLFTFPQMYQAVGDFLK